MSRDSRMHLEDIVTACRKVERYLQGVTRETLHADERTYDATVRNLEIIGEAAKQVPDEIRQSMPSIDWRKVCGFRDVLIHGYFGIDDDILWDVVTTKVPELARAVQGYLDAPG